MFERLKKIFSTGRTPEKEKGKTSETLPLRSAGQLTRIEKKEKRSHRHLTKTGIRKIDPKEDLYQLFKETQPEETVPKPDKPPKSKHLKKTQKNRHGIPILDSRTDYLAAFSGKTPGEASRQKAMPAAHENAEDKADLIKDESDEPEVDFAEIINSGFKGKSTEELLAEKSDMHDAEKVLSLKEKLSLYPYPQARLDLHGCNAVTAERKTDAFLRNAYMQGTQTLLVIVGKGLHSDDGRAVLPDVVEALLIKLKQEKIVLTYEWENKKKTRSGAVIVYLMPARK